MQGLLPVFHPGEGYPHLGEKGGDDLGGDRIVLRHQDPDTGQGCRGGS